MSRAEDSSCTPYLKALADESRWRLVELLIGEPKTVSDLVAATGLSQYNVSKHLRVLRETGIAGARREGKFVRYGLTPAFRKRVSADRRSLNLGCCSFHFNRVGGDEHMPNGA
ncbi:MAG: winged helix-turn-helix transcriptional regulator [Verrucomicrobiae bacterium]|nr:winged helix-turn-helix transcriptional regulator [Verrucomicrobiae bacterium]MCP5539424.1 winged helix-turn-helix transcriptional regulator [Akkermansiaceae bacterium]MCP5551098.1 winged helix-turn-helix transcriptional regulator [Akkermansiaceae bacterium]